MARLAHSPDDNHRRSGPDSDRGFRSPRHHAATAAKPGHDFSPAVIALLAEIDTATICLDMAEQAARAIHRDVAAVHVGVDPTTLIASAEEIDIQWLRQKREGPVRERFARIAAEFDRWKSLKTGRSHVNYHERAGDIREALESQECRDADLLVIAHPGNMDAGDALHSAIFDSKKLVMVSPRQPRETFVLDHVVVGWKPHENAYHTIDASRRWLEAANRLTIICVNDWEHEYARTAQELFSSFSIRADIRPVLSGDLTVGRCLLNYAEDLGASCLTIGAYRHSPFVELLLGRVTRYMLANASIPILMKH